MKHLFTLFALTSGEIVKETLEEALKKECTISLEHYKSGESHIKVEGNPITVLLTLAGLEQDILKQYGITQENFNTLKEIVGSETVSSKVVKNG